MKISGTKFMNIIMSTVGYCFVEGGKKPDLAQQLFDSSFAREKVNHPISYDLAGMYAYKGDKENAYRILREIDWEWGMPYLIKIDPLFDNLRER
jgi:hypothetical protein